MNKCECFVCFEVTRKFETILKPLFAANDDKSPPLTRVLLYSKRSKTLSIYVLSVVSVIFCS